MQIRVEHRDFAYRDSDSDGYESVEVGGPDCDDFDANRFAGNVEVCNDGHDEDCDPSTVGSLDADGDGYISSACRNEIRFGAGPNDVSVTQGDDCDDELAGVHPSANEVCNHRDDDCDGLVDEGAAAPVYRDLDGDGYGDATCTFAGCWNDVGYVTNPFDCDDSNAALTPGTGVCLGPARVGLCAQGALRPVDCPAGQQCRTGVDGVGRCQ